jgi:hypothetical protein
MLDQLEKAFPAVVKEGIPKVVTVLKLTDILQRLVEEEISVRDMRGVLQAVAEFGQIEADNVMLTEHVRAALRRYVSHKYARGTNTLVVYLLDPQIEEAIRGSIKRTSAGTHLALEPDIAVSVDLVVACDTPDLDGHNDVRLGGGPVLGTYSFHGRGTLNGLIPHPRLAELVERCAAVEGIPLQRNAAVGMLTDASYVQLVGQGVATVDLAWPTRYAHTGVEMCDLRDLEQLAQLVSAMVRALPDRWEAARVTL